MLHALNTFRFARATRQIAHSPVHRSVECDLPDAVSGPHMPPNQHMCMPLCQCMPCKSTPWQSYAVPPRIRPVRALAHLRIPPNTKIRLHIPRAQSLCGCCKKCRSNWAGKPQEQKIIPKHPSCQKHVSNHTSGSTRHQPPTPNLRHTGHCPVHQHATHKKAVLPSTTR